MNKLNITQHFVFILVPKSTSGLLKPLVYHKIFDKLIPHSTQQFELTCQQISLQWLLADAHRVLCAENTLVSMSAEANTVFIRRPNVDEVTAL